MGEKQDLSGLIRALASDTMRFEAADTLIALGSKAVEPLMAALKFDNWKVRGNAAWVLGQIGDDRAVDALVEALRDEIPEVRGTAGRALVAIGGSSVKPLEKLAYTGDARVKALAACVLSCIESSGNMLMKPA